MVQYRSQQEKEYSGEESDEEQRKRGRSEADSSVGATDLAKEAHNRHPVLQGLGRGPGLAKDRSPSLSFTRRPRSSDQSSASKVQLPSSRLGRGRSSRLPRFHAVKQEAQAADREEAPVVGGAKEASPRKNRNEYAIGD